MASSNNDNTRITKSQANSQEQTERQVLQDQQRLMAQVESQQAQSQNAGMQLTATTAANTAYLQRTVNSNSAWRTSLELFQTMVWNPIQNTAAALNPLQGLDYQTGHYGFLPNVYPAFVHHDQFSAEQVSQSAMALPARILTLGMAGLGMKAMSLPANELGKGLGRGLGRMASDLLLGGRGASTLETVLGGVGYLAAWTLPIELALGTAQSAVDIGAFRSRAIALGNKYRGALGSYDMLGLGFSPRESTELGINLYKLSRGSGFGMTGAGVKPSRFSEGDVEMAVNVADSAGVLQDADTVQDMLLKIKTILASYKSVAKELHITAQSGMALSAGLLKSGYVTPMEIVSVAHDVNLVAQATGQSERESLYAASAMSRGFNQAGLLSTAGFTYGLRSNLAQSYLYQTHAVPYMPESLGGYNAALMISQQEQMQLLGTAGFQNAAALAGMGGGYNENVMRSLVSLDPRLLAIYRHAYIGTSPTNVYASLWNSQNAQSIALSDPTLQARMLRGMIQRSGINMGNAEAIKGWLMQYYRSQGLSGGQARYTADNMYTQIHNINMIDQVDTAQLLKPMDMNINIFRAMIPDGIVNTISAPFTAVHQRMTDIGVGVAHLGERWGEWMERLSYGIRNIYPYTPLDQSLRPFSSMLAASLRSEGLGRGLYVGSRSYAGLALGLALEKGLRNPITFTRAEQDRIAVAPIKYASLYEKIKGSLFDADQNAQIARDNANIYKSDAVVGGMLGGAIALTAPFGPIVGVAELVHGLATAHNPNSPLHALYRKMHGEDIQALNPDVISLLTRYATEAAGHPVAVGSPEWSSIIEASFPQINKRIIRETIKLNTLNATQGRRADMQTIQDDIRNYSHNGIAMAYTMTLQTIERGRVASRTGHRTFDFSKATREEIHKLNQRDFEAVIGGLAQAHTLKGASRDQEIRYIEKRYHLSPATIEELYSRLPDIGGLVQLYGESLGYKPGDTQYYGSAMKLYTLQKEKLGVQVKEGLETAKALDIVNNPSLAEAVEEFGSSRGNVSELFNAGRSGRIESLLKNSGYSKLAATFQTIEKEGDTVQGEKDMRNFISKLMEGTSTTSPYGSRMELRSQEEQTMTALVGKMNQLIMGIDTLLKNNPGLAGR